MAKRIWLFLTIAAVLIGIGVLTYAAVLSAGTQAADSGTLIAGYTWSSWGQYFSLPAFGM